MATRITPYVRSTEEIVNYPQISEGSEEVIMMPIVSDCGPVTPQIVNNRQLLEMYTGSQGLKRSDDLSLKCAYILSTVSNLMVTRVVSNLKLPALYYDGTSFKTGTFDIESSQYEFGTTDSEKTEDPLVVSEESTDYQPIVAKGFYIYLTSDYSTDTKCHVKITKEDLSSDPFSDGKIHYYLDLEISKGESDKKSYIFKETYEISLNPNAVDGYGNTLQVDWINAVQNYFVVKYLGEAELTNVAADFGNSTYTSPVSRDINGYMNAGVAQVLSALNRLEKYRKDVKIKFLFDGGFTTKETVTRFSSVAIKRKTLNPFSAPVGFTTFNEIRNYLQGKFATFNQAAGKSSYQYCAVPAKIDASFFGWREKLPYSLYYILTVYNNISMNMEFAPVFGKQTGLVDGSNITIPFEYSNDYEDLGGDDNASDLPETEVIQRFGVNPVVYDQSLGTAFFVNNLTYQVPNLNTLSEENNRRLFNSIQFDINKLLDNLIAKSNDDVTRQQLDDLLSNYKSEVLDNLGYGPKGFRWNIAPYNPAERNKLKLTVEVCFTDSIKYVEVLYRAIPVLS